MLTCLTVYKLLSLFLVCSLRIYINEMLLGCVDMQLQVNPRSSQQPVTSVLSTFCCLRNSESIGFSMYPSFELGVSLLRSVHPRFSVSEKICPPKWAPALNQGNLHELKLRLKIVRYPGIEVGIFWQFWIFAAAVCFWWKTFLEARACVLIGQWTKKKRA